MNRATEAIRSIQSGGGVTARILAVGPGQEAWIGAHRRVAPDEVDAAIARVLVAASGNVDAAAAHLNVSLRFLSRFTNRRAVRSELERRGMELTTGPTATHLAPYAPSADPDDLRPIVASRSPRGRRRGAWRVEGLLADRLTRPATVEVLRELAARARGAKEVAAAFGVNVDTLQKWRAHPEVDAIVRDARALRVTRFAPGRLTLDQVIEQVAPFLPAASGELDRKLRAAAADGTLAYPVAISSRQLARFVGRRDSAGRTLTRKVTHRDEVRAAYEWRIVEVSP